MSSSKDEAKRGAGVRPPECEVIVTASCDGLSRCPMSWCSRPWSARNAIGSGRARG